MASCLVNAVDEVEETRWGWRLCSLTAREDCINAMISRQKRTQRIRMSPRGGGSAILPGEIAEVVKCLFEARNVDAWLPASSVAFAQQDEVFVIGRLLQSQVSPLADGSIIDPVSLHVVPNEPRGAFGDVSFQRFESRRDMIRRIDALADIVQQRGEQEFLVVRLLVASKVKDLQAVVEDIAFRVPLS